MPATKTAQPSRIERLRALAEHPNTPEAERAVALRALARLLKKQPQAAAWVPRNWLGEKYETTSKLSMTDLTARIRDEIKLLRKLGKQAQASTSEGALKISEPIGDAPASIRIGIRQLHYDSLNIWIKGIPQEWGWVRGERNGYECWLATDDLKALGQELRDLANAYNYDNSEIETDYFDRRFYLRVEAFDPDDTTYASHRI